MKPEDTITRRTALALGTAAAVALPVSVARAHDEKGLTYETRRLMELRRQRPEEAVEKVAEELKDYFSPSRNPRDAAEKVVGVAHSDWFGKETEGVARISITVTVSYEDGKWEISIKIGF